MMENLVNSIRYANRRRSWVFGGLTFKRAINLAQVGFAFVTGADRVHGLPPILKIDISPVCSLKCPTCLHADPAGRDLPVLEAQRFGKHDRMTVAQFTKIIDEVKSRIVAVSLFYFGDPYAHPDADELCGIARKANLNVHVTSHFSYAFSDERIARIARSGVTHLTVAVDGSTQEAYGVARVNGRLDLVLSNLRRLAKYKRDHGWALPRIEVQHLHHAHHDEEEIERVRAIVTEFDVEQFTVRPGWHLNEAGRLANYTDHDITQMEIGAPFAKETLPRCIYPYFNSLIRYNGEVIPCCFHRATRQHTELDGKGTVGNVFEQPFEEIWNNDLYRANRTLTANPTTVEKNPELKKTFCYGCERLMPVKLRAAPLNRDLFALSPALSEKVLTAGGD